MQTQVIQGVVEFTGSFGNKVGRHVRLVDSDDNEVAECETDGSGNWKTSVDLPPGRHLIHAEVEKYNGDVESSATIPVEVEADDDHEDAIEGGGDTTDQAGRLYRKIVEARARGFDIDPETGIEVLELAGRTMDEFNFDVEDLQRLLANEKFAEQYWALED